MCNSFNKKQQRLKDRRRASRKPVRRTVLQQLRSDVIRWAKDVRATWGMER